MLIHAGDVTEYGTEDELIDFLRWFAKQPFHYKVFIAGNNDICLEEMSAAGKKKLIPDEVIYLQNSSAEIEGMKIYGSPVTPYFLGMAFNKKNDEIHKVWNKIPDDTDILITHGPPENMLDNGLGCESLLKKVTAVKPKLHCFGHIHEQNGIQIYNSTTFVNAALVNALSPMNLPEYKIVAKPIRLRL